MESPRKPQKQTCVCVCVCVCVCDSDAIIKIIIAYILYDENIHI